MTICCSIGAREFTFNRRFSASDHRILFGILHWPDFLVVHLTPEGVRAFLSLQVIEIASKLCQRCLNQRPLSLPSRERSSRNERSHNCEGFLMFVHEPTKTSRFTRGEWQKQPLCIDMSAIVVFLCRGCETGCWAERVLLFVGLILIVLLLSAFDESKQEIAQA